MGEAGEADDENATPERTDAGNEQDRDDEQGADKQARAAGETHAAAQGDEAGRDVAAGDAAEGREGVDDDEREDHLLDVHAVGLFKEIRRPEKEKPPDPVTHEASQADAHRAALLHQGPPRRTRAFLFRRGCGRRLLVLVDVVVFSPAQPLGFAGDAVTPKPEHHPHEAQRTGDDESHLPAVGHGDTSDDDGRDDSSDVASCIEYARGQRAFLDGKPFSRSLDGCGEIGTLAQPEEEAGDAETQCAARRSMEATGQTPDDNGHGVGYACAELVDDASDKEEADGVGGLEG